MASTSEQTFGDRLARAYKLQQTVSKLNDYSPDDADLSVDNLLEFLNQLDGMNNNVASVKNDYSLGVKHRQELFYGSNGVKKRISLILAYCKSKKDLKKEVELIKRISDRISTTKKPKGNGDEKARSAGEMSYGDLITHFGSILESVKKITNYNPPNSMIKLNELEAYRNKLGELSNTTREKYALYSKSIKGRAQAYEDLKDKLLRVKNVVKAQFGMNSNEFISIKGIKV